MMVTLGIAIIAFSIGLFAGAALGRTEMLYCDFGLTWTKYFALQQMKAERQKMRKS